MFFDNVLLCRENLFALPDHFVGTLTNKDHFKYGLRSGVGACHP